MNLYETTALVNQMQTNMAYVEFDAIPYLVELFDQSSFGYTCYIHVYSL